MRNLIKKQFRLVRNDERGFTLLEYVAGAAVILTTVWAAMSLTGNSMADLLTSIQNWLGRRATAIDSDGGNGGGN